MLTRQGIPRNVWRRVSFYPWPRNRRGQQQVEGILGDVNHCPRLFFKKPGERGIRGGKLDRAHNVPSILVPCLCAVLVHPDGGTVTRLCEKLHTQSSDASAMINDALNKGIAESPEIEGIA